MDFVIETTSNIYGHPGEPFPLYEKGYSFTYTTSTTSVPLNTYGLIGQFKVPENGIWQVSSTIFLSVTAGGGNLTCSSISITQSATNDTGATTSNGIVAGAAWADYTVWPAKGPGAALYNIPLSYILKNAKGSGYRDVFIMGISDYTPTTGTSITCSVICTITFLGYP